MVIVHLPMFLVTHSTMSCPLKISSLSLLKSTSAFSKPASFLAYYSD